MMKSTSLALFFLSVAFSQGAQILTFDFAGKLGNEVTSGSHTNVMGMMSSTMSRGAGITASAAADSFNASGWTSAASLDAADYFQFTVKAVPGSQFTITDIEIPEYQRSSLGPLSFSLRSSLDNYVADISTFTATNNTNQQSGVFNFAPITNITEVTFRLYGYSSGGAVGAFRLGPGAGNDLVVNGSVVNGLIVPEPSSIILTSLGLSIALLRRRGR